MDTCIPMYTPDHQVWSAESSSMPPEWCIPARIETGRWYSTLSVCWHNVSQEEYVLCFKSWWEAQGQFNFRWNSSASCWFSPETEIGHYSGNTFYVLWVWCQLVTVFILFCSRSALCLYVSSISLIFYIHNSHRYVQYRLVSIHIVRICICQYILLDWYNNVTCASTTISILVTRNVIVWLIVSECHIPCTSRGSPLSASFHCYGAPLMTFPQRHFYDDASTIKVNSGKYHDAGTMHASSHCFWDGESNGYTRSDRVYIFWLCSVSQQKVGTCKQALADTHKNACRNCKVMNWLQLIQSS